jgi:hypothetical protein
MGKDECNQEFRPDYDAFDAEDLAYAKLSEARKRYPEARSIWVEMLKDKQYYLEQRCNEEYWDEEHDPYDY